MAERQTRRRYLATLGVVGAAGLAGCSGGADSPPPADEAAIPADIGTWPTFGHDAANTGTAPQEVGPTRSLVVQWRATIEDRVVASPAVVDGTVYAGSHDGYVYALAAADGSLVWQF